MFKVSRSSPVPHLVQLYDQFNTLLDRDLVITRTGNSIDTTFTVIPMDKKKLRVEAKPFGNKKFMKLLEDAYDTVGDVDDEDEDEDDEDEDLDIEEEDEEDEDEDEEDEDEEDDD